MSPREHETRTRGVQTNPYGRARENGMAHVAGYAQSLRGAYTEATGNGLEASANRLSERL